MTPRCIVGGAHRPEKHLGVLAKIKHDFSALPPDLPSFQRQESTFTVFNLALIAALLLLQTVFASYWGQPSRPLLRVLAVGFLLKATELVWVRRLARPPNSGQMMLLTWASILLNLSLALVLTVFVDREDSPYFVLMVVPIVEVAFRPALPPVLAVIGAASYLNFYFVWHFFRLHPPAELGEYFEAGISSLIFAVVGLLVWALINHVRAKELRLAQNLAELERTRERLLEEEKLAAVGRLSSAIAHEIRNPVAMISSSLATATSPGLDAREREEMFVIAAKEASRLEALTSEFLDYARPRPPALISSSVGDTVGYVAEICRAHAAQRGVELSVDAPHELFAEMDPNQIQQALLNLVMNAVEASPVSQTVWLRAHGNGDREMQIEVENQGAPVSAVALPRIFEPFFTTKSKGTGLGLAIARNIARAHGGELILCSNQPERICFLMTLPVPTSWAAGANHV
jgi:two-component system, NtrC family, sensor histidine kinase HydH